MYEKESQIVNVEYVTPYTRGAVNCGGLKIVDLNQNHFKIKVWKHFIKNVWISMQWKLKVKKLSGKIREIMEDKTTPDDYKEV